MFETEENAASRAALKARLRGGAGATQQDTHALTIDAVAEMFKISTFELRVYEWLGLIGRKRVDGSKVYCWSHCERVALILKAREAGVRIRDIKPMLKAMDEKATLAAMDRGKLQALSLIRLLESGQLAFAGALDELYRVDWELSDRLGINSGDPATIAQPLYEPAGRDSATDHAA